jgi:hypothetical protein
VRKSEALRTEESFLSLREVQAIATSTGIPAEDVPSLLRFLHEMGIIMWHKDEGLRDVVILDLIKYFMEPVNTPDMQTQRAR